MNIFYRLLHYVAAINPANSDPLASLSLRERADLPPWHEAKPCVDSSNVHKIR